jgi:hypothetical protein
MLSVLKSILKPIHANRVQVKNSVWLSETAKLNACRQMLLLNPDMLFVAWFNRTKETLSQFVGSEDCVRIADQISAGDLGQRMVLFVEHFPVLEVEQSLFARLGLTEVNVLISIEDPLLELFGGARIKQLLIETGSKEDELLSHKLIDRSIARAQMKIASKVRIPVAADSLSEWMERNFKSK